MSFGIPCPILQPVELISAMQPERGAVYICFDRRETGNCAAVQDGGRGMPYTVEPRLKVANLADQLMTSLYDSLVLGSYPTDNPIRQDAIASAFGVSKIPVREAMSRLEQEGLLVSHPNKGFMPKIFTDAEALEITTIRRDLEGSLLIDALQTSTLSLQAKAYSEAMIIGYEYDPAKSLQGWPGAFIRTLTQSGSLLFTRKLVVRLWSLSEYIVRTARDTAGIDRAVAYRESLLAAWKTGDPEAVAEASRAGLDLERAVLMARIAAVSPQVLLMPRA